MTDASFPTTGYLAWQFSQIVAGRLERALRAEELTLAQHNALQQAARTPGVSAAEIARRSGITAQSMGAAVSQLVERGLLRREPHPTSRRSMCLYATDEGLSAAARAASIAARIEADTTSPLGTDDKETIHRLLHHLVEQLNPDALAVDSRS
ncbi:MarR family winged helix-turn-helix transcriptional regulator [Streptomyces griseorubiginosus]|uniref:MarR family winged helix-turn-helix transcriptional regulator n=1 Tax=Streptomyces griseorubiginosus TaxID=67304 RepID=UPI001AD77C4C|nr:MarR family transcriptional regulator [Streptomyces griseorubiginosus]MBO4257457.1 MarR family transcriptional regulator [Streptomyces griseorubiginosus]